MTDCDCYIEQQGGRNKELLFDIVIKVKLKAGLDRPRGFQEVKVPRLHDKGTGWR